MSKVNINGVWKDLDKVFVNIGGIWKEVEKMFCNIGGVWKEVEGLGLVGLYIFHSYIVSSNLVCERRELNLTSLATIKTTKIDTTSFDMDYGSLPNKLLAISNDGYIHELNPNTFVIISSVKVFTGSARESYQHNRVGGTSNYVYTSHSVIRYGEDYTDYYTITHKRNTTTYASIYSTSENASPYGDRQALGIDGVGNRLYRYSRYYGSERIQEINPDNFSIMKEIIQGSNTFGGGLGGGSGNNLVGTLNIGYESSKVSNYNIDTLATIHSVTYTGTQPTAKAVVNLK